MSGSLESGLEDVSIEELFRLAIEDHAIDLHTGIPARVEAYSKVKGTVDVVPQLNRSIPDGQGGYVSRAIGKLSDVPIKWLRCKKFAITFPLEAGDYGLLVVCQRNIGAWRATGQQGDPGDLGLHTLDGAVFLPGLYPDSIPTVNVSDTAMLLGTEAIATGQIEITSAGEIRLGAGATEGVAVGPIVDTNLSNLATAIAACAPSVTEPLATAIKAAFATWFAAYTATGASKTKVLP